MVQVLDHTGAPVRGGRARVNDIRLYYITAGEGPALVLLHGTPKNSYYWYKLFPLLTEHFTLVAPDLRGFGYSDKPPTADGYDCRTNANDIAELMSQLGHQQYHVHGEDRGAEYAYALAALYRDRALSLSFGEMLLSGFGLEESSFWTPENVSAQFRQQGVWCWHLGFFFIPHVPEMLIQGHELEAHALDHWIECVKQPGCLRGILETYRAGFKNAEINRGLAREKLTLPVMTIGAPEFFGPRVQECALRFAETVTRSEIFDECGHSLALEGEERLATCLKEFCLSQDR
ncbi:hypothetical protein G647_01340 [Cladophialophora carrionii CBS 160.54]|uniref:AB hydrolase-1 domain-containing protein n=1 Tax=Cladophialophora carrionii CBS 160.54 TaxID=1279043 RepID=V9DRG8_9EURO|nr:uncharacterized protein G647_01340 [Cladophialophora carrionii CBS 160.54]ETI28888.1 hypothetical protein G647_01340 [Cladophialophora carrionii CBS 160.54]